MKDNVTPIAKDAAAPAETKGKKPEMILVERRERVGLITLNRPKSLNALNRQRPGRRHRHRRQPPRLRGGR